MPGDPEQCRLNAVRCLKLAERAKAPARSGESRRLGGDVDKDWPPSLNPTKRFSAHFLTWNLTSLATRCPRR